jgi:enoyl-CoA hydratase
VGDLIGLRDDGAIRIITLDRPERLNALSVALVAELHAVLDELERSTECDVVVLTGAGRAFCAGIDLAEGLDSRPHEADPTRGRYSVQQKFARLVTRMRAIPQPLIAAVHGPACGGGLCLAAACDIRVVDETARFNAAFVTVGLTGADMGLSWILPRAIGWSAAAELMYTGRFFEAHEAVRLGFASRVTPAGADLETALAIAAEITANDGFGVRLTKEALENSAGAGSLTQVVAMENRSQVLAMATGAFAASQAAFRDRSRLPNDSTTRTQQENT